MGISTVRGTDGMRPQILVKKTHIQMPPFNYWAQYWHNMVYSLSFPEKIARYARSIALYKISVPEIIEIWACNVKAAQNCICLITPKFRRLLGQRYYM